MRIVACFDVQLFTGKVCIWTVPVDVYKAPTSDTIEEFLSEVVVQNTEPHRILDCHLVVDEFMNILYENGRHDEDDLQTCLEVL